MPIPLMKELESLRRNILTMGAMVEDAFAKAIHALTTRDSALAERVQAEDERINLMEIEIEEECLNILALQKPVALDLRFTIAVFRINNDLERIGDVAANIARRAAVLAQAPSIGLPLDFASVAERAQRMLREALDALVNGDRKLAMSVCDEDTVLDLLRKKMDAVIEDRMRAHPEAVHHLAQLLSISRHIERVGDLATNIAEDVIYMLEGVIVRHRIDDYRRRWEASEGTAPTTCVSPHEKKP